MQDKIKFSLIFLVATAGCVVSTSPQSSNSVAPDGSCTEKFRLDYNAVSDARDASSHTGTLESYQKVKKECDTFFSHHDDFVSCRATVKQAGQSVNTQASSSSVRSECNANERLMADLSPRISTITNSQPLYPMVGVDGYCTPEFLNQYYLAKTSVANTSRTESIPEQTQRSLEETARKECDTFFRNYPNKGICSAVIEKNGDSTLRTLN